MPLFAALTCRRRGDGYPPLIFCYLAKPLTCTRRFHYLILCLLLSNCWLHPFLYHFIL